MFDRVKIELTRVRKMAALTDDDLLVYLIDVAITEANAKARSRDPSLPAAEENFDFPRKTRPVLEIVR